MMPSILGADSVSFLPHRPLIAQWANHASDAVPPFIGFDFEKGRPELARTMVVRVVGHGRDARFLVLHYGSWLVDVTGCDGRGQYLDVILPLARRAATLELYEFCRTSGQPVYCVDTAADRLGRSVNFERLLLPFANRDHEVSYIVTAILPIGTDCRATNDGSLAEQGRPLLPDLVCAVEARPRPAWLSRAES